MILCNAKEFFDRSKYSEELSDMILDVYWNVKDASHINDQKFSTSEFYNQLISKLKSEDTPFKVEYSSDSSESVKKLFKQSFEQLKQTILDIIPQNYKQDISMTELKLFLDENMQKDFNAGRLKIGASDDGGSFNIGIEGASDSNDNTQNLNLKQYLEQTYDNCFGAEKQMKNLFSREIFMYTLCNFDKGFYVTNNMQLNENIAIYKNELLKRITKFLSTINPNTCYSDSIYTDEGFINRRYYDALQDMQSYLDSIQDKESLINKEYGNSLFKGGSIILDAIHSYTILKYFDTLLTETLGKVISYNKIYKNSEVLLDVTKYKFSKDTEHQRKSWTDSELRTAVQNTSRFSKFVLQSIPLKVNDKFIDKTIGINLLSSTMTKLFRNTYRLATSQVEGMNELILYLQAFHNSPIQYTYKLLSHIINNKLVQNELRSKAEFTEEDLGVIQSLYDYIFSYDTDMNIKSYDKYNNKSIRAIEFNNLKTSFNIGKYSILSDISGVIDDCMDATYFYTTYGQDGGITVEQRVKYKDRRGSEKYKDTVNAANITYSQSYREKLKDACQVEFSNVSTTDIATVTIPLTLDTDTISLQFVIKSNDILGILAQSEGHTIIAEDSSQNLLQRIYYLFGEDSPIDLSLSQQRERLLADADNQILLSSDEQLFKQLLKFIDDRLLTNFLSRDGLQKFRYYKTLQIDKGNESYLNDLLLYSVKSQIVSDIYYDFNRERLDPDNTNVTSKKDFFKYLKKRYAAFNNLTDKDKRIYFITNNGISNLRTLPSSTTWTDVYNQATLILQGDLTSSVSKNQSGNNDANYVTAFLGGQIFNVCYKAKQAAKAVNKVRSSAIKDIKEQITLLAQSELDNDPNYYNAKTEEEAFAYAEQYTNNKINEAIKKADIVPETAASALLFTDNSYAIKQCVINSDIKNRAETVKSIRDLKSSELFYNAIVHNFWINFLNTGEYCIQPTTYSDKVKLIQYLVDGKYYKFGKKSLSAMNPDEILELYCNSIGKAAKLAKDNVIYTYNQLWGQTLTLEQINNKLKTYNEEQLITEAQSKGIELTVDLHYRVKNINGKEALLVNETLEHQSKMYDFDYLKDRMEQEKLNFINNLVDSGIFFYIDYHDTSLYDNNFSNLSLIEQLRKSTSPIANIILQVYQTDAEVLDYLKNWVKNGKLILAYDNDNNPIVYKNTNSVSRVNPLLEKYFYIESLVSNNLRLQLTGFESNHPDKSKFTKMWGNIASGLKINNQLLNNTTWRNKKGMITATGNIERLQKAKIIWGHSALGKTTYLTAYPNSIIDWDAEFNPIRNKFIANILKDNSQKARQDFLIEAYNYISGIGEYNAALVDAYKTYKQMLSTTWEQVKQKAIVENKKLFASPTILLKLFKNDFDLVLTMDEETFLQRKPNGLAWKQSIDLLLNSDQNIKDKTINVGNLYMYDVMALNDSFDLYQMSRSHNKDVNTLADKLITIVENISQGTQLKRNVIIPATMHYMHNDLLEGVSKKLKVAIIHDMPAKVFNFSGDAGKIDSMDGSALVIAEQSILENKTLGSQEVGSDKKPIWHHYDQKTGTAALMKFASFEINNERMLLSLNSEVPLIRMYKKMTNLPWANYDQLGNIISWNTSREITLGKSTKLTSINRVQNTLDFNTDILEDSPLYYRTYDEEGNTIYKQIVGFGGDGVNGYYTIESYVDDEGDIDYSKPTDEKVYHYFNSISEHHTIKQEGDHTINSLYELWLSLGGLYSQSVGKNNKLESSESSHYAVVGFINKTIFPKEGANTDRFDLTQNSYDQPLKQMMISYLTNNSGMKNGASNRNSVNRWFDDKPLSYMSMDSDGLGVQMDADHDVEEAATMTEFSQVITALEAGGYLHKYAKQVYQDLGRIAVIASKLEIDTVAKFLQGENDNFEEVKSELYDIISRTLLNGIKTREDQASLTDNILKVISNRFNKNINHLQDTFKIPFSDQNIYSQILPTLVSIINNKSIKRKYPGSGCVMVPGFNVIQYFTIDNIRYTFNDVVRLAIQDAQLSGNPIPFNQDQALFEKTLVQNYLNKVQNDKKYIADSVEEFIPTDIVDIMSGNVVLKSINLDDLKSYYKFKDQDWEYFGIDKSLITNFRINITSPRNLAPVRITWTREDTGKKMNVFDLKPFRDAYENPSSLNREAVQQAFRDLDKGIFYDPLDIERKNPIRALNLSNKPAEMVISNMYSTKFGVGNKTIAQIRDEGIDAFRIEYESPKDSKHYDISFTKTNGEDVYISFQSPKKSRENQYTPYEESKLLSEKDNKGNINVYLISEDNRKLFKVGRYILKEGYSSINGKIYDQDNKLVPSKNTKNLKVDGTVVYEYIEFVSKYHVTERYTVDGEEKGDIDYIQEYDKYYINIYNISKKVFTKTGDTKGDSKALKAFITGLLDDIYSTQQFLGIQVNPEISSNTAGNIVKYVSNMKNVDNDFRQSVLIPVEKELREQLDKGNENIVIDDFLRDRYEEFYDKLATARYSSWEQSLYFTAARIPAQTLQSFMQMEAIAYSGNSRNIVYVSHWQAWLQGSDY